SSHRAGHLPGAAAFDWDDLVDPVDGSLVGAAAFAGAMSEIGVGDDHVVVAYDQHEPSASLRLVWALRRYGHEAAYALVGGLAAWVLGGHPLARVSARPPRASFTARVRETPYERSAFVKTVRSNGAP
uniref:sulfurtransferase n=1 Tax=Liquorilactobacillus sicerae TaxID=1416943 RepID=UPI00248151E9